MKQAQIKLCPNYFQVIGPPELVLTVQIIVTDQNMTPKEMKAQVDELFTQWYVNCSVSGEEIPLFDLRYWDVPKQEVYARPELVPTPECYITKTLPTE